MNIYRSFSSQTEDPESFLLFQYNRKFSIIQDNRESGMKHKFAKLVETKDIIAKIYQFVQIFQVFENVQPRFCQFVVFVARDLSVSPL